MRESVAPELAGIHAQLDSLEAKMDTRFKALGTKLDSVGGVLSIKIDGVGKQFSSPQ